MSYRIEDEQWKSLVSKIDGFDSKIEQWRRGYDDARRDADRIRDLERRVYELEGENANLKRYRDSKETLDLVAREKELDEYEAETKKRRKELEDLAYNKGYVAGYVEITQKLGKQS